MALGQAVTVAGAPRDPTLRRRLRRSERLRRLQAAALVAPLNSIDSNDTEVEWDRVGALADSIVKRGGMITLTENGRVLATVQIPPSDPQKGRPEAIAYSQKAMPFLKDGRCPR